MRRAGEGVMIDKVGMQGEEELRKGRTTIYGNLYTGQNMSQIVKLMYTSTEKRETLS